MPNPLIHGQIGSKFAPEVPDDSEVAYNPKKHWCQVQELIRYFGTVGYKSEYLT